MPESPPSGRPTPEQLATYAEQFNQSKSLRYFNAKVSFPEGKRCRVVIDPVLPEHRGGLGAEAVNGGVLAAIFDLAIGCTPALIDPTRRNATVQLSMSFERPVTGQVLIAEAWITSAGSTTLFSSAEIRDGAGRTCARAQGLVRLSRQKWASGSSPAVN